MSGRCGMERRERREMRDERTFPDSEHSEDERIHMEVSAPLSSSSEADDGEMCVSLFVVILSAPSLQRVLREKDR